MANPKKISSLLAKQSPYGTLEHEQEPYLLTEQEEATVLYNAMQQAKESKAYRLRNMGLDEIAVEAALEGVDWLSLIDKDTVLQRANSSKNHKLWEQQQREREKQEAQERHQALRAEWTARMMLRFMRFTSLNEYGRTLLEDAQAMQMIKPLCFFLSEDPRLETELGLDPKKGLLFLGISGLGKTYLTQCAARNALNPITIVSLIDIADTVRSHGEYQVPPSRKLCLDDVGSEEATVNHYGTKINWFKDFIELFYLHNPSAYNRLIISTNCDDKEIEGRYGFRVRSRLPQMFNIISLDGNDLRQ